jgi:hypothetical protein
VKLPIEAGLPFQMMHPLENEKTEAYSLLYCSS